MADRNHSLSVHFRSVFHRLFRTARAAREAYARLCGEVALAPIQDDQHWAQARLLSKRIELFLKEEGDAHPEIARSVETYRRRLAEYLADYEGARNPERNQEVA